MPTRQKKLDKQNEWVFFGLGVIAGVTAGGTAGISAAANDWRGVAVGGGIVISVGVGMIIWRHFKEGNNEE